MSVFFDSLLELLGTAIEFAWECVVSATFPAALLAGLVLVIQWTCSRWLRPAQLGLLWCIVLLRLMMPVAPQSAFSLQKLLPADDAPAAVDSWAQTEQTTVAAAAPATYPAQSVQRTIAAASIVDQAMDWLPMIWLLGCVLILFGTAFRYLLFAVRLRWFAPSTDPRLLKLVDECRPRLQVRRVVRTIVTDAVRQPAVMGVWRPTLLLPPHAVRLSDADLQMVLLHELAHVRRWDLAVNWILLAVRAVHWPNPVCWLAASRFLNLREQSRDAMVLRALNRDARHEYSSLLLTLAGEGGPAARWRVIIPGLLPGLVCGMFEKQAVSARLKAILRPGAAQPVWQIALGIALFAGALVTGCSDPSVGVTANGYPQPDNITQLAVQRGFGRINSTSDSFFGDHDAEPLETRSYDISAAIQRIAAVHEVEAEVAAWAARVQVNSILVHSRPQSRTDDKDRDQERPKATARIVGEQQFLDVLAEPAAHQQVAQFVTAWEQGGFGQIVIEARTVSSPIDLAFRGHVRWDSISASTLSMPPPASSSDSADTVTATSAIEQRLPVMMTVVPDAKLRRIVDVFQSHSRSNILFAPKITLFNGQSGAITDETQRPFVTGVRLVSGRREPQIDVCPDGNELRLHPMLTPDRTATQLTGRLLIHKVVDVMTSSTMLADGPATIQLPHVERRVIDFRSEIRDGESLLVACPPPGDGENYFYLLLTPRLLPDSEIGTLAGMLGTP